MDRLIVALLGALLVVCGAAAFAWGVIIDGGPLQFWIGIGLAILGVANGAVLLYGAWRGRWV